MDLTGSDCIFAAFCTSVWLIALGVTPFPFVFHILWLLPPTDGGAEARELVSGPLRWGHVEGVQMVLFIEVPHPSRTPNLEPESSIIFRTQEGSIR